MGFPVILAKILVPAGKFALSVVLREVFKSEFQLGRGKGADKLAQAVLNIRAAFINKNIDIQPDEIIDVVDAVVAILNNIGVFDDDPGLTVSDPEKLVKQVMKLVDEISDLVGVTGEG